VFNDRILSIQVVVVIQVAIYLSTLFHVMALMNLIIMIIVIRFVKHHMRSYRGVHITEPVVHCSQLVFSYSIYLIRKKLPLT